VAEREPEQHRQGDRREADDDAVAAQPQPVGGRGEAGHGAGERPTEEGAQAQHHRTRIDDHTGRQRDRHHHGGDAGQPVDQPGADGQRGSPVAVPARQHALQQAEGEQQGRRLKQVENHR